MNRRGETLFKVIRAMRPPSLSVKKPTKKIVRKGRRIKFTMDGGPVKFAKLHSPGTLPFRLWGHFGYYDSENRWVEI